MDLILRFWDEERKTGCGGDTLGSQFPGSTHGMLTFFQKFKIWSSLSWIKQVLCRFQWMAPANYKLVFLWKAALGKSRKVIPDLTMLINLGSCGIHVVHGGFKSGVEATGWKTRQPVEIHVFTFWGSPPARRGRFSLQWLGATLFPLKFLWYKMARRCTCGRERALQIWKPHFPNMPWTTAAGSQRAKSPKYTVIQTMLCSIYRMHSTPAKNFTSLYVLQRFLHLSCKKFSNR